MKYSSVVITDDNSDLELEKLADQNGFSYSQYLGFETELSDKFTVQENKHGYEEWVSYVVKPNHSIDCVSPIVDSIIAYEFGNGFMLFGEHDSIYD